MGSSESTRPAVRFTVLGGYLGAGKTTLLNRLLNDNQGQRIALLINDFGAINIDSNLIDTQTDQQINLTNGCVCCGLSDGFDEAIAGVLASSEPPEHIVVEASGVADVHSLAQYGKTPGLQLDAVVVVADATDVQQKTRDKYVANTVSRQLKAADLILLNKIDLVAPERLAPLRQWLSEFTSGAPIVETQFCELPQSLLLGQALATQRHSEKPGSTDTTDHELHSASHAHHEEYVTWHFESPTVLSRSDAESLLAALPNELLRGKGFIATSDGTLEWHKVGKQQRLTEVRQEAQQEVSTALVAIGLQGQLDHEALTAIAEQYLKA